MRSTVGLIILFAIALMVVGVMGNSIGLGLIGSIVALLLSTWVIAQALFPTLSHLLSPRQWRLTIAYMGIIAASFGFFWVSPLSQWAYAWLQQLGWLRLGTIGVIFGALGQILIAILALYIAWEQYIIGKALTIKSNTITQQQTIDAYFEGIAQLMLDKEGLLEDLPMERAIAEGRTAAILGSVDADGKARVLRFLSRSKLLTPLKRDGLLGRAILDGTGTYQDDRELGLRVIDLGVMLAGTDLSGTDLRWTDLSDTNLIRSNLNRCDLVRANLSRTILYEASLAGADMMGVRLFYGNLKTATPRTYSDIPNFATGAFTGAVIENADFTGVKRLSKAQRYYCCAWGGSNTRKTIPGGCDEIPNRLGR